jgi:hypothetical protein
MDDATIAAIIEAARNLTFEEQGQWIARLAIATARELDAVPKDQTPDPELLAWFTGVRNA